MSFINFLLFGATRFGINKIWLVIGGIKTVVFSILLFLKFFGNFTKLKNKCHQFVEDDESFKICYKNQSYINCGLIFFVGFLLLKSIIQILFL